MAKTRFRHVEGGEGGRERDVRVRISSKEERQCTGERCAGGVLALLRSIHPVGGSFPNLMALYSRTYVLVKGEKRRILLRAKLESGRVR